MATVKFQDADEFLAELSRDAAAVERKVVRLTFRYDRALGDTGLSVLATVMVGGHVVRLLQHCGWFMFADGKEATEVRERAERVAKSIRDRAEHLGLEVRAGVYEAAA